VPIVALPDARWCKRIAGQRVAVAADVYWKAERACRLERQRRHFDTATKGRRSENKKVGVDPFGQPTGKPLSELVSEARGGES